MIMFGAWLGVIIWVTFIIQAQKKYHPRALFTLFFSELWERFSFYGMRALLTLYMIKQLMYADETAYGVYAAYGALVYGTPILGGLIADKLYGFRKAIMLGAVLMALGHFAMAIENEYFFFAALALLVIGNGFFKPNISSLLGKLYEEGDPRRDSGFSIFYMGINVGAFLAPLTCGYLGETYGWHYGFGLAGLGMLAGLLVFWLGRGVFKDEGLPPHPEKLYRPLIPGINLNRLVVIGSLLAVPVFGLLMNKNETLDIVLMVTGVVIIGVLLYDAFVNNEQYGRERIFVILVLFFFHMLFWAFFEQAGSSITLFTERNVDRTILGNEIPTSTFQSVNPMFIILLAPLFSIIWVSLQKLRMNPFTPSKFALGIIQLGLGFGMFVIGGEWFATEQGLVPLIFLILGYLFHTTGELCLSPVGLSMITKLSPARIVGFVMGAWFLSISFAHHIAGLIASQTSVSEYLIDYGKYKPDKDFKGRDVMLFKVCDAQDACDSVYTVVDVKEKSMEKKKPATLKKSNDYYTWYASMETNTSKSLNLRADVIDPTAVAEIQILEDKRMKGSAERVDGSDTVLYHPPEDFKGRDTIWYSMCSEEEGFCDTVKGVISVNNGSNHSPLAKQDTLHFQTTEGTTLKQMDLLSNFVDYDGDPMRLSIAQRSNNGFAEITDNVHRQLTPNKTLNIYSGIFGQLSLIAIGAGLGLFLLVPILRKWMHGVH